MKVNLTAGGLTIVCDSGVTVSNVTAFAEYAGNNYNTLKIVSGDWKVIDRTQNSVSVSDGVFGLDFTSENGITCIKGSFSPSDDLSSVIRVCFFKGLCDRRFEKAYLNGSYTFNGVKVSEMQSPVFVRSLLENQREESADMAAMLGKEGCTVAGAVTFTENYSDVEICENGELILSSPCYYHKVYKDLGVKSDKFALLTKSGLDGGLNAYAAAVMKFNAPKEYKKRDIDSGWCSWYYYGPNISERIILDNIAQLKKRGVDVECIQIDDGWNKRRGDWEANEKFPQGMKALADDIKKAGYVPGIWVAPLTAENDSELLKNNPDMFVKEWDSDKIFGWNTIDFSTEKAQKYLYDLFYKLSREWGFRYIKFDFVGYGFSSGRYSEPNFNGVKNYRKALEIMRAAVTDDTFLLACTSPLYSVLGYADGLRISMDIFERWESVKAIALQVLMRAHLNNFLKADPDCVLIRDASGEDGECFRKCVRTEEEVNTYITLIAVVGGTLMFSDKISLLSEEQIEKYKILLPANGGICKSLDIGKSAIPSVVYCGGNGIMRTFAFFNWEDYPRDFSFPLEGDCFAFDFWDKTLSEASGELKFTVAAHGCKVLQLSEKDKDFALAGTFDRIIPRLDVCIKGGAAIFKNLKKDEKILCRGENPVALYGCFIQPSGAGLFTLTAEGGDAAVKYSKRK